MAFRFRAKNRNPHLVIVKYWDKASDCLRTLPRDVARHLDGKPEEEVEEWIRKWESTNGRTRERSARTTLGDDDKLSVYWKNFQAHQDTYAERARRPATLKNEHAIFERNIVPFFIVKHQRKDPTTWHDLVPDFHKYLAERNYKSATIQKVLWTLERFSKYLVFSRFMSFPYVVQVPKRKNAKVTPLEIELTPEEVLTFARTASFPYVDRAGNAAEHPVNFRIAVLLGYFAALSPSELFALDKSDLVVGADALNYSKTAEGFKGIGPGMSSNMAVSVSKTLPSLGDTRTAVELTKNDYREGMVTIWSKAAAIAIAALAKQLPEGRTFPFSYGWLSVEWRKHVTKGLGATPHDLRRASCLYLGRTLRIPVTLLQEHMRHAEIETTLLYMRAPAKPPRSKSKVVQNFDDVA